MNGKLEFLCKHCKSSSKDDEKQSRCGNKQLQIHMKILNPGRDITNYSSNFNPEDQCAFFRRKFYLLLVKNPKKLY